MRVTPRTALLLAAASVLALIGATPVMLLVMLAIAVVAVLDAFAVRRPPSVTRHVGGFARGVPTSVTVTVDAPNASAIEIRQPVPPDMTSPASTTTERTLVATLVPRQRGRYELPIVAVRTDGPLGLGRWYHQHGEPVGGPRVPRSSLPRSDWPRPCASGPSESRWIPTSRTTRVSAPNSSRSASTAPTTTSGRSTGERRRASAVR